MNMDKLSDFFSTLLRNDSFVVLLSTLVALPIALWQTWYFRGKKGLSESELKDISKDFDGINGNYVGFHLVVLMPLLFLSLVLFLSIGKDWMPVVFGIRFFPAVFFISAAYGLFQGLFAIFKGVYPMGKSLLYVHDDKSIINRVAKTQIVIAFSTFIGLIFWALIK
jgi:hypothetical protein